MRGKVYVMFKWEYSVSGEMKQNCHPVEEKELQTVKPYCPPVIFLTSVTKLP